MLSGILNQVNAFWQPKVSSAWHYFGAILSILASTVSFISLSRGQHDKSVRNQEQISAVAAHHVNHWHRTAGRVLDIFMQRAFYSQISHDHIMSFFAGTIVPFLGPSDTPDFKRWKSFMTDDHTPIELSWDWRGLTDNDKPIIRFSVEPVGLAAGTSADPVNTSGPESFKHMLIQVFPKMDMSWFNHFDSFFNRHTTEAIPEESHQSRIFWGFDLCEAQITTKAYFFPGRSARKMGTTNLGAIGESLASAPHCTPDKLQAFHNLASFAESHGIADTLEFDMLAIDMVDPMKSRLKLYFRDRRTTFSSVRSAITLKGQKSGAHLEKGLRDLKQLWISLFDLPDASEDAELQCNEHRTAGILYNAEFRLGSSFPDVKIYIPVRHYSRSDQHVLEKVGDFIDTQRKAAHLCSDSAPRMAGSAYVKTMKSIL
ncbi:aromatic prenyltransferase [Hypoxylon rubiginosum]|uniref:Aromatic prenyltransferase n=1 Tax=Hypoxylon rubiginosum TaxID=110542 RepID=A0ACC0D3H2_9PEZI|nr:aromatic prenyltransferase [Hypoxylon rubiginosum]